MDFCSISKRYVQVILLAIGYMIFQASRVIVGVATVRMMSNITKEEDDGTIVLIEPAEFDWSDRTVGFLESSFYWGFLISLFPAGGLLPIYFPAHRVFGLAAFTSMFLNLLMPTAIYIGPSAATVVRITKGAAEGIALPSFTGFMSSWAPP